MPAISTRIQDHFEELTDPRRREPIMVMLRAATTNAQAAGLLRETLMTVFLGPLGARLEVLDCGRSPLEECPQALSKLVTAFVADGGAASPGGIASDASTGGRARDA